MLTVLLGLGVGVVVGVVIGLIIMRGEDAIDHAMGAIMGLMIGFLIGGFLGFVGAAIYGSGKPLVPVVSEKHQLASFHDAAGIEGSFFLGIGSVDTQVRVYYYEVTPDGYQLHWMDETSPDVYIVQENRTDGELDVVTYTFQNASDGLWGIHSGQKKNIFHVPNGTIMPCFKVNAGTPSSCPQS